MMDDGQRSVRRPAGECDRLDFLAHSSGDFEDVSHPLLMDPRWSSERGGVVYQSLRTPPKRREGRPTTEDSRLSLNR